MFYHVGRAKYININIFSKQFAWTSNTTLVHTFVKSDVDICPFQLYFSHISDIVQTDYLSIIAILDIDRAPYTCFLMWSLPFIMITFTYNIAILHYLMPSNKRVNLVGRANAHMFHFWNKLCSTLNWIMWSLLSIWSLSIHFDYSLFLYGKR
jgi:hypothetical protein